MKRIEFNETKSIGSGFFTKIGWEFKVYYGDDFWYTINWGVTISIKQGVRDGLLYIANDLISKWAHENCLSSVKHSK